MYRNYTKKRAIDSLDEIEKLLTELLERLWDDIHDYKALIDSVNDAVNKFGEYAKELDIDAKLIDSIKADCVPKGS